ncbi:Crossover junction endodeoxyribonuclease RuvC [Candidatus Xiphinematobacter sp. Idaho Grape]|uniref:crossover junction endodeoxyribonuclease RuvC n=1 Tax=Candidatus Xiphinematobacter sp. Idaho Grape TaxID=1704307 RepID=UPI000706C91F|nr:crossover junction endodeoxyribonuclease RuvC [Candidatus Xiphinematobacter sp. Idaho Grape]ALJ56719.1 Crossover junction endodeoxyribonuclease RuvC [Candidatus Xiphinematobacter sp. Idaho Grape]
METILAVDPSLRSTGYAILCRDTKVRCLRFGTIRSTAALCLSRCLLSIHQNIAQLIMEYSPVSLAVEAIIFVQNHRTAINMGGVHGAVLLSAAEQGLPVHEYAPRKVKQAVVGYGTAEKYQVAFMVRSILGLAETPPKDVADAMAVGLCHFQANSAALFIGQPSPLV